MGILKMRAGCAECSTAEQGRTAFRIGLTGCIGPATMEIVLALPVRCVRAGWFYSRTGLQP